MNRRHHKSGLALGSFTQPDESWRERTLPPGTKVLLVEDEPELRTALKRVFARYDCEVFEAGDGESALAAALQHLPHVVVSDFEMPFMNGFELIRRMRHHDALHGVPVMMLTGSPRAFNLAESLECELAVLLRKPIGGDALVEAMSRTLGARLPARPQDELDAEELRRAETHHAPTSDVDPRRAEAELQSLLGKTARDAYDFESDRPAAPTDMHEAAAADAAPIIKMVNAILGMAVDKKASDIHIEPQEKAVRVRFRIDGGLIPQLEVPIAMCRPMTARLKIMASLNISERRVPQDGRFRMRLPDGRKLEIRLSTLPSQYGEKVVMRLLGQARISGDLRSLKLHPRDLECMQTALANPNGLILVTGPTGSGKTSTLYTMISSLNSTDRNIVTAEDPVEYEMPGITQVNVRNEVGFTFDKALRAFLRQDPDVILVGEVRDAETANTAMKASVTGHLVLSTLHTNDAVTTVTRLVDMGVPPYMVAAAVRLVVAQRLVRTLCIHCKQSWQPTDSQTRFLTKEEVRRLGSVQSPKGCERCDGVGFKGRTAVMEVLHIRTTPMREAITRCVNPDALQALAVSEGMRPLRRGVLDLVERGETSLTEALKILVDE
ncbi:MAG: Flp pilus assembly complex ATPase component TadA [Elusimicrobia bacterium]|nr:Flp pilus assembly complex ATPase component TadA [Elusimicrobiota bacterium]